MTPKSGGAGARARPFSRRGHEADTPTSLDLKKEKNFFETRVTDYQTGGSLDWD
ncbi:hypothetical protein HFP15_02250 [Amycolatopsis sp. K13G38]|uniref:Uncharacterized protein n=1 Tax=Amycolatopsis acididurans TaxID=2724524 RepID=A0ABX1IY72_9PSEU|nr:hypothetical protein [Amycolatopsis acididurans]NKQ51699.1 hypothetical protein [Amycolatopsis acididurans]